MSLQEVDRQIYLAIEEEKKRQENGIESKIQIIIK